MALICSVLKAVAESFVMFVEFGAAFPAIGIQRVIASVNEKSKLGIEVPIFETEQFGIPRMHLVSQISYRRDCCQAF